MTSWFWVCFAGLVLLQSCVRAGFSPQAKHFNNTLTNYGTNDEDDDKDGCSRDMFSDPWAYWACVTERALQRNWFPSPIAGLFSYQVWNGFDGFWQNGAVLEPMVNFIAYAGHTRYQTVIRSSLRTIPELIEAYFPNPSYDDMSWYGLSYLRVYEVLGDRDFLATAHGIFDWIWDNGWDTTGSCHGGMWFDQGLNFKPAITNAQMLQMGAKLFLLTGRRNATILGKVMQIWNYLDKTHTVNASTGLINDGIFYNNCSTDGNFKPSYTSGVLGNAFALMADIFDDQTWMTRALFVFNATMIHKTVDGVLTEFCDYNGCPGRDDEKMFKGIYVRNLRYVMEKLDPDLRAFYHSWLEYNVASVLDIDACLEDDATACNISFKDGPPYYPATAPVFDTNWSGPYNGSAPMQQTSVLDLFVSLISPGTTCSGPTCSYDPPVIPPKVLTCKDAPCPKDQACCQFKGSYRTCCTSDQKCKKGICE